MVDFVKEARACTTGTITWTVTHKQIESIVESLKAHFPDVVHTANIDWDNEDMYRLRCVLNPIKK